MQLLNIEYFLANFCSNIVRSHHGTKSGRDTYQAFFNHLSKKMIGPKKLNKMCRSSEGVFFSLNLLLLQTCTFWIGHNFVCIQSEFFHNREINALLANGTYRPTYNSGGGGALQVALHSTPFQRVFPIYKTFSKNSNFFQRI